MAHDRTVCQAMRSMTGGGGGNPMYAFPIIAGASAVLIGGYALSVALRRGDDAFRDAQAIARTMRYAGVLPVWAMRLLFYPSMVGLIGWGAATLADGLGLWSL